MALKITTTRTKVVMHSLSPTVLFRTTLIIIDHNDSISPTVEPLLWDTSIQGSPPFRGHKIWSRKNVHIIFVSILSSEGTPGERHTFSGSRNPGLTSIQGTPNHSESAGLTTKRVNISNCALITMIEAFTKKTD